MISSTRRGFLPARLSLAMTLVAWIGCLSGQLIAQEEGSTESAEGLSQPTITDVAKQPESESLPEEQTIYIPFSELEQVFEREGRGVFVPYEQFQELWEKARAADRAPSTKPVPLPYDAMITSADNEATVAEGVMTVQSTLVIELLKPGWNTVPLRLAGAAIQTATIGNESARIVSSDDGGYELLIFNETDDERVLQETEITLQLTYVRPIQKSPGLNSVAFDAPQAPINRWKVTIPEKGLKIEMSPMVAAATSDTQLGERPNAEDDTPNSDDQDEAAADESEESTLLAFVGVAKQVQIRWNAKVEGATGMTSLTNVMTEQRAYIAEGTLRTTAQLDFAISRAPLTAMRFRIPTEHKVIRIVDSNIRKWSAAPDPDNPQLQIVAIELFEPAKQQQRIQVELEQFVNPGMMQELAVPSIEVLNVVRQQGALVVSVDANLRGEAVQQSGLLQVDLNELPQRLQGTGWDFAYRFAAAPFTLRLAIEERQPEIQVRQLVEMRLEPEELHVDSQAIYSIQRAGVYQLEYLIPVDYEILSVTGQSPQSRAPSSPVQQQQALPAGIQPARVDTFHLQDTDDEQFQRLIVNLSKKALGEVGLAIELRKSLEDIELAEPTETAVSLPVVIPRPAQAFLEQLRGSFILYAPESLRINLAEQNGLRSLPPAEAHAFVLPLTHKGPGTGVTAATGAVSKLALSMEFSDQPIDLSLSVQRRAPYTSTKQFVLAKLEEGVFSYETAIEFDIRYSPVKQLSLLVPDDSESPLRNVSNNLREEILDTAPEGTPAGFTVWRLTGDTELIGKHRVLLKSERKIDELKVGGSLTIDIPQVRPLDVDLATGQVAVTKTETFGISTNSNSGLRPIDPTHDLSPLATSRNNLSRAFEFVGDWSLEVEATRYAEQEVKRTSIERGLVHAVVTRSGQISYQALYRLRSARQRLALQLPPEAVFAAQPVRINGQAVSLQRGDQDILFIPLTDLDPQQEFALELRYSLPKSVDQVALPTFPEDPAIQKVYLGLFLPEESNLVYQSGSWTEEFDWQMKPGFQWKIANRRTPRELENWIKEGLNCGTSPAFQTDGVAYLFSALQPAPPPDGEFNYSTMHRNTLAMLVVGTILALGLLFLRHSFATKVKVLAIVVTGLLLLGVFAPNLARQLIGPITLASLICLAAAWIIASFVAWTQGVDWQAVLPRKQSLATEGIDFKEQQSAEASGEHDDQPTETNNPTNDDHHGGEHHE